LQETPHVADELSDNISRKILRMASQVLLDDPYRTGYGLLLGMFLNTIVLFGNDQSLWSIHLPTYAPFFTGLFICHLKPMWECATGKNAIPDRPKQLLALVEQAQRQGLSESHVRMRLNEICQLAISDCKAGSELSRTSQTESKQIKPGEP
jgi:hypothetical protein